MNDIPQTFHRKNRLRHKTDFAKLFDAGTFISNYPVKTIFLFSKENVSICQFGISVPKRYFKRAVHRNRVKRIFREVVRKNKHALEHVCIQSNVSLRVLFVYQNNQLPEYDQIEQKLIHSLNKLLEKSEDFVRGETI